MFAGAEDVKLVDISLLTGVMEEVQMKWLIDFNDSKSLQSIASVLLQHEVLVFSY
jgi:hypothetical protein